MSAASDAMQTLTTQWYNALTNGLRLDPMQFQLVQGNIALGATSQGMWSLMDSIPPFSIAQNWTPSGFNSFSAQYGLVISRLQDPSFSAWQTKMGDYYSAWTTYLKGSPLPAGTSILAYFQSWAFSNMPPDQAQTCASLFAASMNGPILAANNTWYNAGGPTSVKAYNQGIETVDNALASAPSAGVQFDSTTTSSDATQSWAKGSIEGFYDAFFGHGDASYSAATTAVADAGLVFSIQFSHLTTIPVIPLQQGTIVAGPTTYSAWYVAAALSEGYDNNNNQVWAPGTPDWSSFFGDGGSLPRATTALVLVDGITVSITSKQSIATSDQTEVQAAFQAGFFPFFGVSGEGGWSSSAATFDAGTLTVTASCAVGNPQVLGILQTPIEALVGSVPMMAAMRAMRTSVGVAPRFEMAAPMAPAGGLVGAVTVAWTYAAQTGLLNLGVSPAVQQLIVGFVNTWAINNAPGWGIGVPHQYVSGHPAYTATAQVASVAGGNRAVNVIAFV
jgi:hypothetical protein